MHSKSRVFVLEERTKPSIFCKREDLPLKHWAGRQLNYLPAQEHVYSKILENFPALSKAGGFEICLFQRGGGEDAGFTSSIPLM